MLFQRLIVVLGPVASIADSLTVLAQEKAIDGAILDVNLKGEKPSRSRCPAQVRHPCVLATGYEQWALPEAYKESPAATSPSTCASLPELCLADRANRLRRRREGQLLARRGSRADCKSASNKAPEPTAATHVILRVDS